MKKIKTLFKKDMNDLSKVTNEIDSDNLWVLTEGIATQKFDGTACAIINGYLYKRYDAKNGKQAPCGAIPCCEKDITTGHHPHWVKIGTNDKQWVEAFDCLENKEDGTYELCGEKIQKNPENIKGHKLLKHGSVVLPQINDFSYGGIKKYLEDKNIEGIVFHNKNDDRMCKIRKVDFGLIREVNK